MGTISSGIGLISGFDYQSIIEQLLSIDARPRDLVLQRVRNLDAQRTAYMDISARLSALLGRVSLLSNARTFSVTRAASSAPDVLSAVSRDAAQPGSQTFVVRGLAATQQHISRGLAERTARLPPGELLIESAQARTDTPTRLDELNGHAGVQRGAFRLIDATGREAVISITDAVTLDDVVTRINAAEVGIRAAIHGGGLTLRSTVSGPGAIQIREVNGGRTATDLGFPPTAATGEGELVGATLRVLTAGTPLDALNDGLGVRAGRTGNDFTVTTRDGRRFQVDLSDILKPETRLARLNSGQGVGLGRIRVIGRDGARIELDLSRAQTMQDVQTALEGAFGGGRLNVVLNGSRLIVRDTAEAAGALVIEDLEGTAARDLGIAANEAGGQIDGRAVLRMSTVADALAAITHAVGNQQSGGGGPLVTASIDAAGRGLVLTDATTGIVPFQLTLEGQATGQALRDLGFTPGTLSDGRAAGRRLISDVNTVLLRTLDGGRGLTAGLLRIEANGRDAIVNLESAETLRDVLDRLNAASAESDLGIEARLDATGTRLEILNTRDGGDVAISDLTGDFAERAGLRQSSALIRGVNLQRQYINERTRLSDLNLGAGVGAGQMRLTDSNGRVATLRIAASATTTLGDVIRQINELSLGLTARINDTGDGLLLEDTAGGPGAPSVTDVDGTVARGLNLLRSAAGGRIDGAYEYRFETGGETLDSLAARLNSETALVRAEVFSDGSGPNPFRLSLTSRASGLRGALIIDSRSPADAPAGQIPDLSFTPLSEAADARILLGSRPDAGVLLTSPTNSFRDVVGGLDLTVSAVSAQPVTVTVSRDFERLNAALTGLVSDFNTAVERITQLSSYDSVTQQAGVLLGDGPLQTLQSRLFRLFTESGRTGGTLERLRQVGIELEGGKRLRFNEEKFREVFESDPAAVTRFFAEEPGGVAHRIRKELENLAVSNDGLIKRRTSTFERQRSQLEERVGLLNEQLERKRQRLVRQFQGMEQALSQIQSQQSALSSLAALVPAAGSAGIRR